VKQLSFSGAVRRALALATALSLVGCRSTEFLLANAPARLARVDRHPDLVYGPQPRQSLDVYAPRGASDRPVVIFWYGGSWVMGKKSEYRFVGTTLAESGFVAVLPDYRLYPQVTFPVFDEDGARAVAWVQQHAREFGGDPTRIVLMGHSAGAHTAAFLALNEAFLRRFGADPRSIVGLVGLSGPYALVPDSDELRATFPPPYTPRDWQPLAFVTPQAPPVLLLQGASDHDVSPHQSEDLRDALERDHVPVELHLYPNRGHGSTVASFAPIARWNTSAVRDTVTFINRVAARGH
jgi:acetyl esterase/lipase